MLGQGAAIEWNTPLVAELGNTFPVQGVNPQRLRKPGLGQLVDRRQVPFEEEVSADGNQRKQQCEVRDSRRDNKRQTLHHGPGASVSGSPSDAAAGRSSSALVPGRWRHNKRASPGKGAMPLGDSGISGLVVVLANDGACELRCVWSACREVSEGLAFSPAPCDINAQALSARADSGGSGALLGRSGRGHPRFG